MTDSNIINVLNVVENIDKVNDDDNANDNDNDNDNVNDNDNIGNNLQHHKNERHAKESGKYVKNIVFGGLDGIITTFSIIAAAYGANFENKLIIIMGVANLIADGISMGLGDFISSYYENLYILSERDKELYEYENNTIYEINEMIELYENEGLEKEDAKQIVYTIGQPKYKDYFIKTMVKYELDLEVPSDNFKIQNLKEGAITFLSFISYGFIPVLTYIIYYVSSNKNKNEVFIISCFITALSMFTLGFFQAKITNQNGVKYGLMMLFNGSLAATSAFLIGYALEEWLN